MGPNDPFKRPTRQENSPRETQVSDGDRRSADSRSESPETGSLPNRFDLFSVAPYAGAFIGAAVAIAWILGVLSEALLVLVFGLIGAMLGAALVYVLRRPDRLASAWSVLRGGAA